MLSGEGNKNGEKTIGLISKKATLHVQHTFFVHFLAVVLHNYNVKLPETSWLHVLWRKCRTCSRSIFFHCPLIFTLHWWPLAFPILSPSPQNFHVVLPTKKMSPPFFISRSRPLSPFFSLSFAGPPPTFSISLSFSCSIFQICCNKRKKNLCITL